MRLWISALLFLLLVSGVSAQNFHPSLEPPVCGDDSSEYLIEEMGESRNAEQNDGDYACTPDVDTCFLNRTGTNGEIYGEGNYSQAEEADELTGRFKQDREVCERVETGSRQSDFGVWWDQDYGDIDGDDTQETCRVNSLWGPTGVRWMDESYVEDHPHAVTGGIDDDWNSYLEEQHGTGAMTGVYTSKPWNKTSWDPGESPVPTGSNNRTDRPDQERKIDTKGFCGGDDGAEYLVRQRCETDLCSTSNNVVGVADDPEKCMLEENTSVSGGVDVGGGQDGRINRDIYEEGSLVNVDTGAGSEVMACFDGTWNNQWPVTFVRDNVTVPLGYEDRVSFRLINVESEASTFDLELSFPAGDDGNDLDALTTFEESSSNELTTTVAASSSQTYNLRVRGNRKLDPTEVELIAESQDGSLEGSDIAEIEINNVTGPSNASAAQTRDVPGMTSIQLMWLMMMASALYFTLLFRS